jgi:protein O-GlcNAc transferase
MENLKHIHFQSALKAFQKGDLKTAKHFAKLALSLNPASADCLNLLGIIYGSLGEHLEAEKLLLRAASLNKKSYHILFNLGTCLSNQDRDEAALKWYEKSIELNKTSPDIWVNYGKSLAKLDRLEESLKAFDTALKFFPNHPVALVNRAATLYKMERFIDALESCQHATERSPNLADGWQTLGSILSKVDQHAAAVDAYTRALHLNPTCSETWHKQGLLFFDMNRLDEALDCYERALSLRPGSSDILMNQGVVLQRLQRYEESLLCFSQLIKSEPQNASTRFNLGIVYGELKNPAASLACYDEAVRLNPSFAEAWNNRGNTLHELGQYPDAIQSIVRGLELGLKGDFALGNLVHSQLKICEWSGLGLRLSQICTALKNREQVVTPFVALGVLDSPKHQRLAAEIYLKDRLKSVAQVEIRALPKTPPRIKIGYFSMDFREHAVAYLIAELFELHSRNDFEIFGFSFGENTQDSMRKRIELSVDHFFDVSESMDRDIVSLARSLNIDIAVDLGGLTKGSRPEIFSKRVAPIQINYLGYPGTMGSEDYEYIIADKILIPPGDQDSFSEKVIYLPDSYQVNDRKRTAPNQRISKSALNLPEGAFVYCCFNNNWKILPEIFDLWMKIIIHVEGSILWLFEDNSIAANNLKHEASLRGVSPDRIIFAKHMPHAEHLARYQLADLFLDTLPYNAHTTASDALWAGLPVLTRKGKTFAGRVAASLLGSLDLGELVTATPEEYVSLATELAHDRGKLSRIKQKLEQNKATAPLFDTPLFTKYIESAYKTAYQLESSNTPRNHIYV